jgi:hypothetical protein
VIETVVAGLIRSFCRDCHHLPVVPANGKLWSDIPCTSSHVTHCTFQLQASFVLVELVSFTEITFELLRDSEMKLAMNWYPMPDHEEIKMRTVGSLRFWVERAALKTLLTPQHNTPPTQHNPRRVPKLLNWKQLPGGFKSLSQLYNPRCCLIIEAWVNKSSLHCDHTNAKFDYHLPLLVVKPV